MGNMKDAKAQFEQHKHETLKKVRENKDLKASIKAYLQAKSAQLRAAFEQEHAAHNEGYAAAVAGVDAEEAGLDEAVDAIVANTGK